MVPTHSAVFTDTAHSNGLCRDASDAVLKTRSGGAQRSAHYYND